MGSDVQAEVNALISRFEDELVRQISGWGTRDGITSEYERDSKSLASHVALIAGVPDSEEGTDPTVISALQQFDAFWSQAELWIDHRRRIRGRSEPASAEDRIEDLGYRLSSLRDSIAALPRPKEGPFMALRAQLENEGKIGVADLIYHIQDYYRARGETRFTQRIKRGVQLLLDRAVEECGKKEKWYEMELCRGQFRTSIEYHITSIIKEDDPNATELVGELYRWFEEFDRMWDQATDLWELKKEARAISVSSDILHGEEVPSEVIAALEAMRARIPTDSHPALNDLKASVESLINEQITYWRNYGDKTI